MEHYQDESHDLMDLSGHGFTYIGTGICEYNHVTKIRLDDNKLTTFPDIKSLTQLEELSVSGNELKEIPMCVYELVNLVLLNLNDNNIKSMSSKIGKLSQLKCLQMKGNDLSSVPDEISELLSLQSLELSNNSMLQVPTSLGNLKELKVLDLQDNNIRVLPRQLKDIELLEDLLVKNNPIEDPPPDRCSGVEEFRRYWELVEILEKYKDTTCIEIDLRDKGLTYIPATIGQYGHIKKIRLSGNNLSTLPDEVKDMEQLQEIDLSCNKLVHFPPSLMKLTRLSVLDLSENAMTSLPNEICSLSHLQKLNISGNNIGVLPLAMGEMTELTSLEMRRIGIEFLPPELGNVSNLEVLDLTGNHITSIPRELKKLSKLKELIIDGNSITEPPMDKCGSVADFRQYWQIIEMLEEYQDESRVEMNFTGRRLFYLPNCIGDYKHIKKLRLSGNELTTLPDEMKYMSEELDELDLSCNKLDEIPRCVLQLTNLTYLNLNGNVIHNISPDIKRLRKLQTLDLNGNKVMRLIRELAELPILETLQVGGNPIEEPPLTICEKGVPEFKQYWQIIGMLEKYKDTSLDEMNLSGNGFICLPASVGEYRHIKKIILGGNKLSELPETISELTQLEILDLSHNKLKEIPSSLFDLSNLSHLDIRGNQISLIPPNIGSLQRLETLDVSENCLSTLPREIKDLTNLKILDIGGNDIKCPPMDICSKGVDAFKRYWQIIELMEKSKNKDNKEMDLNNQNLEYLPCIISEYGHIKKLNLQNNRLSDLPDEMRNLTQLEVLDVSGNKLENIPPSLYKLTNLQHLILSGTRISIVDSNICNLTKLELLDVKGNVITKLPPELGALDKLEVLDLQDNDIHNLPRELTSLKKLTKLCVERNPIEEPPYDICCKGFKAFNHYWDIIGMMEKNGESCEEMDLSSKQLVYIPSMISQYTHLKKLNLHNNYLSALPEEVGKLTDLEELNLSRNKFPELPSIILNLSKLSMLDVSDNQLSVVSSDIGNIKEVDLSHNSISIITNETNHSYKLTKLDVSKNRLTSFRENVGMFEKLQQLNISINEIKSIDGIHQLCMLTYLNIENNPIKQIPQEISKLKTLTVLKASNNYLTALPSSIAHLVELLDVDLSHNEVTRIPKEIESLEKLTTLNLCSNKLESLPRELGQLPALKDIRLDGNPDYIGDVPSAIYLHGIDKIKRYWRDIDTENSKEERSISLDHKTKIDVHLPLLCGFYLYIPRDTFNHSGDIKVKVKVKYDINDVVIPDGYQLESDAIHISIEGRDSLMTPVHLGFRVKRFAGKDREIFSQDNKKWLQLNASQCSSHVKARVSNMGVFVLMYKRVKDIIEVGNKSVHHASIVNDKIAIDISPTQDEQDNKTNLQLEVEETRDLIITNAIKKDMLFSPVVSMRVDSGDNTTVKTALQNRSTLTMPVPESSDRDDKDVMVMEEVQGKWEPIHYSFSGQVNGQVTFTWQHLAKYVVALVAASKVPNLARICKNIVDALVKPQYIVKPILRQDNKNLFFSLVKKSELSHQRRKWGNNIIEADDISSTNGKDWYIGVEDKFMLTSKKRRYRFYESHHSSLLTALSVRDVDAVLEDDVTVVMHLHDRDTRRKRRCCSGATYPIEPVEEFSFTIPKNMIGKCSSKDTSHSGEDTQASPFCVCNCTWESPELTLCGFSLI